MARIVNCRHCDAIVRQEVLDLGMAPPSNAYRTAAELAVPEQRFPLRIRVCERCWLVQTEDVVRPEDLFTADYAYFSSTSTSWSDHAKTYVERMIRELGLGPDRLVVEIACNDGYLLRHVVAAGIPCIGVEPTHATAEAARAWGVPVVQEFFDEAVSRRIVEEHGLADLIVANNVYAHVPDINGFTRGLAALLAPGGTLTIEFAHLLPLIERAEFDTMYHEHFSYLSLRVVGRILAASGLRVWDVQELTVHGGSLRVFACHADDPRPARPAVDRILDRETEGGLEDLTAYRSFQSAACRRRDALIEFLTGEHRAGRSVVGYGAAAKGNTLLNFAGITAELLPVVADAAPSKQGMFLPGSGIPVVTPDALVALDPDRILVLPWNLAGEIREQLAPRVGRAQFVVAGPELAIL